MKDTQSVINTTRSNYEQKRTTVRIYSSTKQIIENIVGNRRDRANIQEFANASDIYEMLDQLINDNSLNKLEVVIKALDFHYKKAVKIPHINDSQRNEVTVKIFKTSRNAIENTMHNDRSKTYTKEIAEAVKIYSIVYYVLGENTENKKELLRGIIKNYLSTLS